ncbi:unnamed protein product [Prorocentrum cordatum]|uniref:Uncharacterized protein n=1 Tax=Prorocentrum cordatum TaxID=2364126 RepID=A0ABN9VJJ5_9DINO|nr:unnamed protein product [Polarella glacialis]
MAGAFLGLPAGWAGLIDRWGVPALQAWVARCPAVELPPCPACPGCSCPACPPCPGASVGATTGTVALACGGAALAGASLGALGTFTALRLCRRWLRSPLGLMSEAWAWVLYNVVGAPLFNQRRVAGQLALTSDVIIVTPDDMVYAETLLTAGPDISAVRFSATRWPPPPGIDLGATHRFRQAPSAAREAAWLAAAVAEADAEFGRRHPRVPVPPGGALVPMAGGLLPGFVAPAAAPAAIVGPVPPPDGAAVAPPAAGVAATAMAAAGQPAPDGPLAAAVPGPAAGVPIAPGAPPAVDAPPGFSWKAPAGWSWVLAEDAGGLAYGSVVQVGPIGGAILAARAGRRATVILVGGASAMAFLLEDWRRGDFIDKWRGADARILARTPGVRLARSWLAVTASAVEVADPSITLQPRSAGRCAAWLLREGGPIQRRESWKSRKRLNSSDWGVSEHHAFSTVLEDLTTHDEVSVTNLLGASNGSSRPSSMACPALLDVVGKELERNSQIKKNARKLREEAKAAAGPKAGGAKGPISATVSGAEGVHGTFDGSGAERQRDLFPLPVPGAVDPGGLAAGVCSRAARRRARRAASAPSIMRQTVEALNGLSGAGAQGGSLPRAGATLAQQQCLTRVADSVSQRGPPPGDLQPLAALQELQAALSYGGSLSTRAEATGVSRLSLPLPGNHPVALERLLGAEVFDSVYRVISCKVLPKTEVLQRRQSAGSKTPYSDPCLRDPRRYAALARRLREAGVVDLVSDAALVVDEVGLFSAAMKSGKQRLVVDARPANFQFGDPEGARLATGAALAAIELPGGANLWTASADVADAFYNVQLPGAWRPYFALPPLRLWPRLAALPMGWPRALAVRQRVSEAAADRAGLPVLSRIADRRAGPSPGAGAHLVYVDNFASRALEGDTADRLKDDMVAELRSEGFPVHGGGAASLHAQVRQVVGHYTFLFMVRRPLPAVFSAVCRFIARAGGAPRPWWPSVRRELTWAMGVVPLAHSDLRARWLGRVLRADASERGRGVCEREMSNDVAERMGRIQERWRFRDPSARAPREQLIEPLEPLEALVYSEPPSKGHVCSAPSCIQEPIETDFEPLEVHRISGGWVVISSGDGARLPQWAALVVAGGVTAALRWIPSEANPADLPSRRALRIGARLRWDAVLTPAPLVATAPRQAATGRPSQATASLRGQRRARRSHLSKAAEAAAKRAGRAAARAPEAAPLRSSAGHVLRALSISATTRAKYTRLWAEFVAWMTTVTAALLAETADDLLAHWMDQQCAEGWNPERGAYMLAALKFMVPQFGRGGQGLPKALQALRGWRGRVPARTRLPLPWEIVALVATRLIDRGQLRVALYVLVTFAGYPRPSEAPWALGAHVIPPTPGGACDGWSLVLHPRELSAPSMTQVYDEVIPFDLPFYSFLPSAPRWLEAATHPSEPLFPFPIVRVSSLFKESAEDMGLASITPQLRQLRHSGPSVELALQVRTLASVRLRGRWRTDASVARYLKPGRVNEQLQRLAPEVFSGEGVLAAALRCEGALAIEWDIARGADWDLADLKLWGLAAVTRPVDRAQITTANKRVRCSENVRASCKRLQIPLTAVAHSVSAKLS